MPNLALNLLPLESDTWLRAHQATDGKITGYTGGDGFANAAWPTTFTLDFQKSVSVKVIRLLLWDNLGNRSTIPDARKYEFSIGVSTDGEIFTTIYSNNPQQYPNGWFIFNLHSSIDVRYIRLYANNNTANQDFQIVEFEVWNEIPNSPGSSNTHHFFLAVNLPDFAYFERLVNSVIEKKNNELASLQSKIAAFTVALAKINEASKNLEAIKQSHDYQTETLKNKSRATKYLYAAALVLLLGVWFVCWSINDDKHPFEIVQKWATIQFSKPYTPAVLGAYYITKAVIISTLLYLFGWLLKNYMAERHNYIINKHKAMTLQVATNILLTEQFKGSKKDSIFDKAMELVFTHQPSGYNSQDNSSPNIINTILDKVPGKESIN